MNERLKDIFDEGNCLTEKQLRLYAKGQLTPVEQNFVEQHLSSCELCSDALEGILLMQEPDDLKNINDELKEKVKTIIPGTEEKEVKVIFPWRIAASFVLILVSGLMLYFFLPKHDNDTLFTQEYKPYPVKEKQPEQTFQEPVSQSAAVEQEVSSNQNKAALPKPQSIRESGKTRQATTDEEVKEIAAAPIQSTTTREEEVSDNVTSVNSTTFSTDAKISKNEGVTFSAKKTEQKQNTETAKDKYVIEGSATRDDFAKSSMSREKAPFTATSNYDSAMTAYKNADYKKAVELFNKIDNKPEALFYAAVSYLSLDQPKETIRLMNNYRETGTKDLLEESYWYEALANLKRDNKKEVKKLLDKVIEFNGTYRTRAEELLQKL